MPKFIYVPDDANTVTEFQGEVSLGDVNITGGTITGIVDLAVADGGTGASTAAQARTNLGITTGTVEEVQDTVGAMFTGNTETNITVTYQDSDGTIDVELNNSLTVNDLLAVDIQATDDLFGEFVVAGSDLILGYALPTPTLASDDKVVIRDTSTSNILSSVTPQSIADFVSAEVVSDIVGTMVTGNTETNITVTYQDGDNTLDFEVPAAGDSTAGVIEIAVQSELESASSTTLAVTPGRQHYHPSAAKAWVKATSSGTSTASYNVTSITDGGLGDMTVVFDTDFSSEEYVCVSVAQINGTVGTVLAAAESASSRNIFAFTYGTVLADPTGTDPNYYHVACFGDL